MKLEDDTVIQIRNVRLMVNGRLLPLMMQTKLLISIKTAKRPLQMFRLQEYKMNKMKVNLNETLRH